MSFKSKSLPICLLLAVCLFSQIHLGMAGGPDKCCDLNRVTVNGTNCTSVEPDIVYLTIKVKVFRNCTEEALKRLAKKVEHVVKLLDRNDVEEEDVLIQPFTFTPKYSM